jgi:hypothetical protein
VTVVNIDNGFGRVRGEFDQPAVGWADIRPGLSYISARLAGGQSIWLDYVLWAVDRVSNHWLGFAA